MNPTMLKGEQMSDLQNKWIELDEIIQSIAGRNTEMSEKKAVSDYLKSLGMQRVIPKVITERLQDRRIARIYVWLDSPIGNVGLLTGNSISPSLHYLILKQDNVDGDDVELEVSINRSQYVSVPISVSLHGFGQVDMPKPRQKPVRRSKPRQYHRQHQYDEPTYQRPIQSYRKPRRSRSNRIRINPVFILAGNQPLEEKITYEKLGRFGEHSFKVVKIEDVFPTVLELSVLNKFFPEIVVADSAKLSENSVVATLSSPYLSERGYYIQLQYDLIDMLQQSSLSDAFDKLELIASIHQLDNAQLLQRFNFEIVYDDVQSSWGQLYNDLFSTFAPFVGEEITKFVENPSAYTVPNVDVIDKSDVIDVSDIPATDEPVEPRIADISGDFDTPTLGAHSDNFDAVQEYKDSIENDFGTGSSDDIELAEDVDLVDENIASQPSSVMSLMADTTTTGTSVTQQQPFTEYLADAIDTNEFKASSLEQYIYPFFKGKYKPRQVMVVDEIRLTQAQYDDLIEDLFSTPSWLNEKGYTEKSFGQTGGYIDGIELKTKEGFPDYYGDLKIKRDASDKEITKAFRKLAVRMHPDRNQDDPQANQKFMALKKAYDVLSDASEKSSYDRLLSKNTVRKGEMIPRMVKIVSEDRMPFYGYTGGYSYFIDVAFDLADLEALEKPPSKEPLFGKGTLFIPTYQEKPPYTQFAYSGWDEDNDEIKYYQVTNFKSGDTFLERSIPVSLFETTFKVWDEIKDDRSPSIVRQNEETFTTVPLAYVIDVAFDKYGLDVERYNYVLLNRFFKQFVNGYPFNVKASIKSPKGSMNYFNTWTVKTDREAKALNELFPYEFTEKPKPSTGFYHTGDFSYAIRGEFPTLVSRQFAGKMASTLAQYLQKKLGNPISDYVLVPMDGSSYRKAHAEKVVKQILNERLSYGNLRPFGYTYNVYAPMFGTHGVTVSLSNNELDILICLCVGGDANRVASNVDPSKPFYALRVKKSDTVIAEEMENVGFVSVVTSHTLYQALNAVSNNLDDYLARSVEPTPTQQEPVVETKTHWSDKARKMTLADGTVVFDIPRTEDANATFLGNMIYALDVDQNKKFFWGAFSIPFVDPRFEDNTWIKCTEKLSDALKDKRKMPKQVRSGDYALLIQTVDNRVFMIAGTGYQDENDKMYGHKRAYEVYWREPYDDVPLQGDTMYELLQTRISPKSWRKPTKTMDLTRDLSAPHNFYLLEKNLADGEFHELFEPFELNGGMSIEPYGANTIEELLAKIPNIKSVYLYPDGWYSGENRTNE